MKYLVAIDIWESKITVNGERLKINSSSADLTQPTFLELVLGDGTILVFDRAVNTDKIDGFVRLISE